MNLKEKNIFFKNCRTSSIQIIYDFDETLTYMCDEDRFRVSQTYSIIENNGYFNEELQEKSAALRDYYCQ